MATAGCRVFAPACPGSAAPASSTRNERTFAGYAAGWASFLDAVGERDVALVAGHSFGGGVATAFVYAQPGRASALLLVNAIGSPTWALFPNEVRTMMQRPVWDWGRHFGTDLLHSPHLFRMLPTLLEDFIPNLLGNPLGMFRTGEFIRRADLVHEVRAIAETGDPGQRGLVRPRRPGAPIGLRRAPARRRCRGGGGRGRPRLADRRSRPPSGSWPSAPWSTPGPLTTRSVAPHRAGTGLTVTGGRGGRTVA